MLLSLLKEKYVLEHLSYVGQVIVLETVNSTNQYLIDNLSYLNLGTVCLAETQTDGRGRYGKYWISPYNNSLYLSFYWFFLNYYESRSIFVLSLVVSVVIGELLQELGVQGITIKWPNDIYLQGRKLAGVLVETITKFHNILHVVVGVGVNLKMVTKDIRDDIQIISLEEIGFFIDRNILAVNIINLLYRSLVQFERCGFFPFISRWLALDSCYNRLVKVFIDHRVIFGVSRGINGNGLLLLEHSGSIYSYSFIKNISLRLCESS